LKKKKKIFFKNFRYPFSKTNPESNLIIDVNFDDLISLIDRDGYEVARDRFLYTYIYIILKNKSF